MKRSEVDINKTWDLSMIYKTENEYEDALSDFKTSIESFVENYKGKIKSFDILDKSIKDYMKILEIYSKIDHYATLPVEADSFDDTAIERLSNYINIQSHYLSMLSFYENEVLKLDDEILNKAKNNKDYKIFIENILRMKERILSEDVEEVLSKLSPVLEFPYRLYNDTKLKDIKFDDFEVNGKTYELSYNSFEGYYEYIQDMEVRRKAFENFSKTIELYKNTTASAYSTQVNKEKIISKLRGYDSVIDYLLDKQNVSRDLYNRQIDIIMEKLAPHMRKYANILKKVHNMNEIKYSDLKIEIDPDFTSKISFEDAKNYVIDGLSIMGEDYISIIKKAFENRWIDYVDSEGKSTGAFAASPYGTPGFILMTFNENMSDTMTLAHELGHAAHFTLTHENQTILNSDPSMYFVEAPSTTNELIVENYLLHLAEEKNDKRMKRWILSQMIAKTYYHNFVTHLLEAHYQREVYKLVDEGKNITAKVLSEIFLETLKKFWGDSVELEKGSELTWMRQPHYYMGLYSYTYSAGLTIGTQVSKRIRKEGEDAASQWKEVLKMGGSKSPLELAKEAGVDISTDKPLIDTVEYIGSLIDEIEKISVELGDM